MGNTQEFLKSGQTSQRIEVAVVVDPFSVGAKRKRLLQAVYCFFKFTGYTECARRVVQNIRVLRLEFECSPRPLQPTFGLPEIYERNCSQKKWPDVTGVKLKMIFGSVETPLECFLLQLFSLLTPINSTQH